MPIPKAKSVEDQVEHVKEIYRLADEKLKERGTSMKEQVRYLRQSRRLEFS